MSLIEILTAVVVGGVILVLVAYFVARAVSIAWYRSKRESFMRLIRETVGDKNGK